VQRLFLFLDIEESVDHTARPPPGREEAGGLAVGLSDRNLKKSNFFFQRPKLEMLRAGIVKVAERSGTSQAALTITRETYNGPSAEK